MYFVTVFYKDDMISSFGILHSLHLRSLSISGSNILFIPNKSIKKIINVLKIIYNSVETYNFIKINRTF